MVVAGQVGPDFPVGGWRVKEWRNKKANIKSFSLEKLDPRMRMRAVAGADKENSGSAGVGISFKRRVHRLMLLVQLKLTSGFCCNQRPRTRSSQSALELSRFAVCKPRCARISFGS